ncbi:MAG: sulfatase, partial [Planctomycetota bacterium]
MRTCSAALVVSVLVLGGSLRAETPPNIILIYTDDFPWFGTSVQMQAGDVGSHTPYQRSPNIDRLASEGLTFSRAYAPAGMCGPSRASLQLGQSTARSRYTANAGNSNGTEVPGIEQNGGGELLNEPTSLIHLPSERTTVGEALQAQGYATAHFGKWHLWGGGPENHGYDVSDGETNNTPGNTNPDPINDPKLMFSITQDSIDFMQQQNAADKPFFIQMSHYATHGGFQYRPETYEYYENLQAINDQVPESGQNTARETAAMFEDLDTTIGMVLDEVDNLGIADNTYVVFTSDNGMGRNLGNNYLRGAKWWLWDAALRVPMIVRGPDIPAGTRTDTNVVQYDYMPTFVDWAGGDLESLPDDIDGVSLRGLMENPEVDPDYEGRSLYFHYPHTRNSTPQSAVVKGTEKLIIFYEDTDKLYYFDTSVDPFESFNISEFDDR